MQLSLSSCLVILTFVWILKIFAFFDVRFFELSLHFLLQILFWKKSMNNPCYHCLHLNLKLTFFVKSSYSESWNANYSREQMTIKNESPFSAFAERERAQHSFMLNGRKWKGLPSFYETLYALIYPLATFQSLFRARWSLL